jgi:hypothetical protein
MAAHGGGRTVRRAVMIAASLVGAGVAIQVVLQMVSILAGYFDRSNTGSLAGDAGFFAAFFGLALVPLALLVAMLAGIGRYLRAKQDPAFFTRAIWVALAMMMVSLGLLLADAGTLGGGIIPH